jgi:hypothetical protein
MIQDWTAFEGLAPHLKRVRPKATLYTAKQIYLNEASLKLIGSPNTVRLYYDVSRSRIGVRAEDPNSDHAIIVERVPGRKYGYIRAAAFCNRFGITPMASVEFQNITVDEDGILVLDLKTATTIRL